MTVTPPIRVVIVLFPRTKLLDVTGPLQVFNDAKHPDGSSVYAITLASEHGGPVETDAGVPLPSIPLAEAAARPIDTLLVSGGRSALDAAGSAVLLAFLRDQSGMVRRLGSICLGAFILAAAGRFDALHAHMREHAAGDLSVPELARIMAMSPRHFARVYAQETGISPAKAVEAVRLDLARDLLEETDIGIQQIAVRAGFGDDERLRRAFLRRYGVAPGEYRTRFGNARTA